jgi:hypothetical protein
MISRQTVLALFILMVLAVPSGGVLQGALAQDLITDDILAQEIIDRTFQDIAQDQQQDTEQNQDASNDADQSNEATVSQDETNDQSNVLVTGDNEATTTQSGSNEAAGTATAASEGGSGGDVKKAKKSEVKSSGGDSEAEAEVGIEQEVDNEAVTLQDSSATGNTLSNENTFGDDVALVTQDNTADQTATNVGVQDPDQTQDADQTDTDFNFQYGFQCRGDFGLTFAGDIC